MRVNSVYIFELRLVIIRCKQVQLC